MKSAALPDFGNLFASDVTEPQNTFSVIQCFLASRYIKNAVLKLINDSGETFAGHRAIY